MAFKAYIIEDFIDEKEEDIGQRLEPIPSGAESQVISDLRWNGTVVVDANNESDFFIDDNGVKRLLNLAVDAVEVSGSFVLNRRAAAGNDRIERSSGSFINDGFTVGSWIGIGGSSSSDGIPMKVALVEDLDMEIDETITRIVTDEAEQNLTIHQGWQELIGINFKDELKIDLNGLWSVKSDSEIQEEAISNFDIELKDITESWVIEQTPYPERHRNPPEAIAANARIVTIGMKLDPKFEIGNIYNDWDNYGKDIYRQKGILLEDVTATFDNGSKSITINLPTSASIDDLSRAQRVTITVSSNNNKTFTISGKNNTLRKINLIDDETLTDELSASGVTIYSIAVIKGYIEYRNLQNPAAVAQENWERSMQEGVAVQWFDDIADKRKSYFAPVRTSDVWASSISYSVGDVLFVSQVGYKKFYKCNNDHISSSDFVSDLANNWDEYKAEDVVYEIYPRTQIES